MIKYIVKFRTLNFIVAYTTMSISTINYDLLCIPITIFIHYLNLVICDIIYISKFV